MESYSTFIILLNVPNKRNWWVLFGDDNATRAPVTSQRTGGRCTLMAFPPDSVFGLSRQTLNEYGVVEWEMLLLRAVRPGESAHLINGVRPGAELLLSTHGKKNARLVQRYLELFDVFDVDPALTPTLHRKAAPFLQQSILPEQLVCAHLEKRRAG